MSHPTVRKIWLNNRLAFSLLLAVCLLANSARAQDRVFNGSVNGNWSNAANWTPNDVPDTAAENAVIDAGGAFTVNMDGGFTIGNMTIGADDQLDQPNSRDLTIAGTSVVNNGLHRLMDGGSVTDLVIGSSQVTFSGSGELTMTGSGNNRIFGSAAGNLLVNSMGHTISGGGQLGAGTLSLTNSGFVTATLTTLNVNPGSGIVTNQATMQADGGVLLLQNGTFNNNGTIRALNGSEVQLGAAANLVGGTLTTDGNAASAIRVVGTMAFTNVTNQSRIEINNSFDPVLTGSFTNNGQVNQNDGGSLTDMRINGAVTMNGTGTWSMSNSFNNRWFGSNGSTDTLTNGPSHTINGAGRLGADGMGIINDGVIEANLASGNRLEIDPADADVDGSGSDFRNNHILQARNNAFLQLQGGVFNNASGTIQALEAAEVELAGGAVIVGGILDTDANVDSVIRVVGIATLQGVTNQGRLDINNSIDPILAGTITNNGQVNQNDVGSITDVRISGDVTLAGDGTWTMSNSNNNRWFGLSGSSTEILTNSANHTIEGRGQLGTNGMGLINNGFIDANNGSLSIDPSDVDLGGGADVVNNAILQASGGGSLNLDDGLFQNNNTIRAQNGSAVNLRSGSHVRGGNLSTFGTGVIAVVANDARIENVTLTPGSTMNVNNSIDPILIGTITNNGQVNQNDVGSVTDVRISGDVTLAGNGKWTMSNSNNNRWFGLSGSSTEILTNSANHTIEGRGQLGTNGMGLINDGLIDANNGRLLINPSDVDLGGGADVVNNAILQASGGGLLDLDDGLFQNNNTIRAQNGSAVNLRSGSHVRGGNLSTFGTGVIAVVANDARIENVTLTPGSTMNVNNSIDPILIGTITNQGQVNQNDAGSITDVRISGDVTLAGNGTWTMSNSPNNRWFGLTSGTEILTNSANHTINGRGQLGTNAMGLVNDGLIDANTLTLSLDLYDGGAGVATFFNAGTLRASNGAIASLDGVSETSNTGTIEALANSTVSGTQLIQQLSTSNVTAGRYRALGGTLNIAPAGYQPAVNNGVIETVDASANNDVLGVKTGATHNNNALVLNNGTIVIDEGANLTLTPVNEGISTLFTNTGNLTVGGDSTLDVSSRTETINVPSDTTNAGLFVDGGTLSGSGTIAGGVYMPSGILKPGDADGQAGLLSITGDFNMDDPNVLIEDAVTTIELGGYTRGTEYDSFSATGDFFGQGELHATLINGFLPNISDEFVIATYVEDGNVVGNLWDNYTFNRIQFSLDDRVVAGSNRETILTVLDVRDIDFNDDDNFDCADVDALVADIVAGTNTAQYDLNFDGSVDSDDLDIWLTDAGALNLSSGQPYLYGDATLDGLVDGEDFIAWNAHKFTNTPAWCSGDFNADGIVDGQDFIIWNAHKFTSSGIITRPAAVPEPSGLALLIGIPPLLITRRFASRS